MFKILIVDDEQFIRKGILSILSRNLTEGITCIEASNGEEALIRAREQSPHLIITDISMPGCDGLEFIGRLREENKNTPIVILSGYDNFEYAQKAIRLGVKEYVMKPIKKQEFITLIQDYIDDIEKQRARAFEEITRKMENDRIMERLKHDFLLGLLKCPGSGEARRYMVQLKELGMEFAPSLYICAVIQYKVNEENQDYIDFAVKNILDEYFCPEVKNGRVINVAYDLGQIAIIFEGTSKGSLKEPKKRLIRTAASLIKKYCKTEVYAGVGDIAMDFVHLHTSLRHALLAADFKLYNNGDIVTVYDEMENWEMKSNEMKNSAVKNNVMKNNDMTAPPGLVRLLRPVDSSAIFQVLEGLQNIVRQKGSRQVLHTLNQEYEEIQEYISLRLLRLAPGKSQADTYKPLADCWSSTEMMQEVKERLSILKLALEKENAQPNLQLRRQILQYVDDHVTEDMDLNLIAGHFKRTPGYISTIFKMHTEGGFNTYITKKRIEIAKKLLADSSIPIQEISRLSGFTNAKYFSVVFKKTVGETPREYRNRF